ncbi:MAG: fused MFS/spermidine synthase, partial [Bacteroidales bacterium]|nr:fused MFS/spermidine synthase [Bacteroidales bacterium]
LFVYQRLVRNGTMMFTKTALFLFITTPAVAASGTLVHEVTSPYHHIMVKDYQRTRILHFDASTQSRMSLDDPNQGHFEYTEYFHMPWLWNDKIKNVLMIGLGGSSIQRAYQQHYPHVKVTTVELDPKVVDVAKSYFHFQETNNMNLIIGDGRIYLRRTRKKYDLIILDAYTANRYGSYIPYTLATQEFFQLAKKHLNGNGILAYNVIGTIDEKRKNLVASLYRTILTCFPHVSLFPSSSSYNVVMIATCSPILMTDERIQQTTQRLFTTQTVKLPAFRDRAKRIVLYPPDGLQHSPILTDDFAPVDGLLQAE